MLERAFGGPDEADLVERLRADGDVAVALVAEHGGMIAGHILFSPMRGTFGALALAPVAVLPSRQRLGIGSALVGAGIAAAREYGAEAIFVLGDPDYYGRFGFDAGSARPFPNVHTGPYFQMLALGPAPLAPGPVAHAPAFG